MRTVKYVRAIALRGVLLVFASVSSPGCEDGLEPSERQLALTMVQHRLINGEGQDEQGPDISEAEGKCSKFYSDSLSKEYKACLNMMLARVDSSYGKSFSIAGRPIYFHDKGSGTGTVIPETQKWITTKTGISSAFVLEGIWGPNGLICSGGTNRWGTFWLLPTSYGTYTERGCGIENTAHPWAGDLFKNDEGVLASYTLGGVGAEGVFRDGSSRFWARTSSHVDPMPGEVFVRFGLVYSHRNLACTSYKAGDCTEWAEDDSLKQVWSWIWCPRPFRSAADCSQILTTYDLASPTNRGFSPATMVRDYQRNFREYAISSTPKDGMEELLSYFDSSTNQHFLATRAMMTSYPEKLVGKHEGWVFPYTLSDIKP